MTKKMTYLEQLRHPEWQKKRLEALSAANWKCSCCGSKDITLNVHHKQYFKGRKVWEYEIDDLQVLCEECHEITHHYKDILKNMLLDLNHEELGEIIDVIAAWSLSMTSFRSEDDKSLGYAVSIAHKFTYASGMSIEAFKELDNLAIDTEFMASLEQFILNYRRQNGQG